MIRVRGLRKAFGPLQVLKGVDLDVDPGQVVAIAGPNASGKTTLIKSILGLVKPDAGEIEIDRRPVLGKWEYRQTIGYMPQIARFPENLTGDELLEFVAALRERPRELGDELLRALRLNTETGKPLRTLSGGTRQKISAVLAFQFDPAILILDEPTAGLDPVSCGALRDRILAARAAGRAVVLTSHTMSEIEEIADRLVFLLEGQVRFAGGLQALREETGESHLDRALARLMEARPA